MKPEEQVITLDEYKDYLKGKKVAKIEEIWEKFISTFPEDLKKEARTKGFHLKEIDKFSSYINLLIEIPEASEMLDKELINNYPFIICLVD